MVSPKTLRIVFEKTGTLQFISHLDLIRTMETALRRAKIPVVYSEGFNPRMKIVFALPLSIGIESVCEFMDIRLEQDMPLSNIKDALAKNLPKNLNILDVYYAESKFVDIKYAAYMIYLDYGADTEKAVQTGEQLFSNPLVVLKRTKSGEKDVDIQPLIRHINCTYKSELCETGEINEANETNETNGVNGVNDTNGVMVIEAVLCADSANYLNPFYLIGALDKAVGHEAQNKRILRTCTFTLDESEFR